MSSRHQPDEAGGGCGDTAGINSVAPIDDYRARRNTSREDVDRRRGQYQSRQAVFGGVAIKAPDLQNLASLAIDELIALRRRIGRDSHRSALTRCRRKG